MPTHFKGNPQQILALDTYIKLTRASESISNRINHGGTLQGLTPSQFSVLEALYHLGPMTQGELSVKLLKSTGNMTLVIDNLEKQNMVRRERSGEDRRLVIIMLTEKGQQTIEASLPEHISAILKAMSALTPEEQTLLGNLCRKLGKGQLG